MKVGEKISINIGGVDSNKPKKEKKKGTGGGLGTFKLKAPPPANLTEIEKGVEGIKVGEGQKKEEVVEEDEDWGDFEGA